MEKVYKEISKLIVELGDTLPSKAGKIQDIGIKKQWLTKQDLALERKLSAFINKLPGTHTIFAEELHTEFIDSENVWVIDPISHTFSYLHGLPHYAVVVSHLHKGILQFTAVYDPTMKELFTARKGKGAFLNNKRLRVLKKDTDGCILFEFFRQGVDTKNKDSFGLLGKLFGYGRIKIIGSVALDYAYVAAGRAQAAVIKNEDGFTAFAGRLLVEEAGGTFTDFSGKPYKVGATGAIASNGLIHKDMVKITKGL